MWHTNKTDFKACMAWSLNELVCIISGSQYVEWTGGEEKEAISYKRMTPELSNAHRHPFIYLVSVSSFVCYRINGRRSQTASRSTLGLLCWPHHRRPATYLVTSPWWQRARRVTVLETYSSINRPSAPYPPSTGRSLRLVSIHSKICH